MVFETLKYCCHCEERSDVAIPRIFRIVQKRTNALTNRPELLGDCHDQCAHWSRNDSSNERSNTNLPLCLLGFHG